MKKINFTLLWWTVFLIYLSLSGCVSQQPAYKGVLWKGEMTGECVGKIQLYLDRSGSELEMYNIRGIIEDGLVEVPGVGSMTAIIRMEGQLKGGVVRMTASGSLYETMDAGSARIRGEYLGTMGKSQAFGTYKIYAHHQDGVTLLEGEWNIELVEKD